MAGLQGVGKTTACGKLALALQKKNKRVLMVATDVYRPAAIDQLVSLGERIKVQSLHKPQAPGQSEYQKSDGSLRVRVFEFVRRPVHFSGSRSLAHPEQLSNLKAGRGRCTQCPSNQSHTIHNILNPVLE